MGVRKLLGSDGCVHDFDCGGGGVTGTNICQTSDFHIVYGLIYHMPLKLHWDF